MKKLVLIIFLVCANNFVLAEQEPVASLKDKHIKFVQYDQYNIVKLVLQKAYVTQIVLDEGEKINLVTFGVKKNWDYHNVNNILYIKPIEKTLENSNLIISTDKRNYNITIQACQTECKERTYSLIYTYNGSSKNSKELKQIEQQNVNNALKAATNNYKNYQYTAQGNQELRPVDTWDNGQFTYFKLKDYKNMPSVYVIKDDKSESLVNSHIESRNTIVIHQIAKSFILRSGKQVLAIHNENYGNQIIENNITTNKYVERLINEK